MARIRHLEIHNFRSIHSLDWSPSAGINCIIGPGDSGKSSVLDAIDLCLGARRVASFSDTDFYGLDVSRPILILATLGALPDALLDLDSYGEFLRGFDAATSKVEDEPRTGIETVLTVRLKVTDDLDPSWSLYSERADAEGSDRGLSWKDRTAVAPARIGSYASTNLSWARGSVLNRLTEERADLGAELAAAARDVRTSFGNRAGASLADTLRTVTETAGELGVQIGTSAFALLDSHSVSIGDGAIALHDEYGVPLRALGTGSARLLVAGLQRKASQLATIALVDEVEYGLEPHRLARFLDSLGAKESPPPLQIFMTSHSPVAVRELNGDQVFVARRTAGQTTLEQAGIADDVQSTLRTAPEAFLARSIIVCEGASEVGLARGLDQHWVDQGKLSFFSLGGAYVDVGGSNPDRCFNRGLALLRLGYRVLTFLDADKPPTKALIDEFLKEGGQVLTWRDGRTLEDEIFLSLPDDAVGELLEKACECVGRELIEAHISSKSDGAQTLGDIEREILILGPSEGTRKLLGIASRIRGNGWFKSISDYQDIARAIVGPHLNDADTGFQAIIAQLSNWTHAA